MHPYKADSQIYISCLEHSSNFKFFCPTFYWISPLRYTIDQNKLWNILQETQIPDHLTCLLRNLYAGQEATVRTRHETTDFPKWERSSSRLYILSPCLSNLYAEYSSQGYGFSSSYVRMWELDYKESRMLKNWCFWTVVLEKTLENPLDSKEIKPINPKGNQSWIFIGRTDAEAVTPILWPPDVNNWLRGKDPDAGKDWRQQQKRTIEDETVGWHHWVDGHVFEQALGVGDGQGSLACCSLWGYKESDMTERLNWTDAPEV